MELLRFTDKLKNYISGKKKILIFTDEVISTEQALSADFLFYFIKASGIDCSLVIEKNVFNPALKVFKRYDTKINHKVSIDAYVIAIDYSNQKISRVSYDIDDQNGKLMFYIFPEEGEFDFKNISYENRRGNFDGIIIIGKPDIDSKSEIYKNNSELFTKTQTFNTNFEDINLEKISLKSNKELQNFKNSKYSDKIAKILLDSYVYKTNFLHGYEKTNENSKILSNILSLIKDPAVLHQSIQNIYSSKTALETEALNKLFSCKISYQEYSNDGVMLLTVIDASELDQEKKDYFAKLLLENRNTHKLTDFFKIKIPYVTKTGCILNNLVITGLEKSIILIESNDKNIFNLRKLSEMFDARGNSMCSLMILDKMEAENAPEVIANLLKDMYN